ncbi:hypothetical protein AB0L63_25565 [Nocardia sp. NPDC051990]|uniref:hypothetical protein n=1 Tax=Nocardia sp. NPDC051990 TaxID=3155285 RepID=UPI00342C5C43
MGSLRERVICQTDADDNQGVGLLATHRVTVLYLVQRIGYVLERFVYEQDPVVAEPFAHVCTRPPEARYGELFARIREVVVN